MTSLGYDWTDLVRNLHNSRKSLARLSVILQMEGANPRVSGMFFKLVVQTVLLTGSETWIKYIFNL